MMILLGSLQLKADEAQCRAVLKDCDAAVTSLQQENALQKQIIADEDARYTAQSKELSTQAIWRPIAIGGVVVIGVETLVLILKH